METKIRPILKRERWLWCGTTSRDIYFEGVYLLSITRRVTRSKYNTSPVFLLERCVLVIHLFLVDVVPIQDSVFIDSTAKFDQLRLKEAHKRSDDRNKQQHNN
jgi:hypothetical protein